MVGELGGTERGFAGGAISIGWYFGVYPCGEWVRSDLGIASIVIVVYPVSAWSE